MSPIDAVVGGESEFEWGCYKIDAIGSEEMGLGGGSMNTRMIIDECVSTLGGPTAADVADNFKYGGFDDWYLPSHDELHSLRVNLKDKGLLEMEHYNPPANPDKKSKQSYSKLVTICKKLEY
ncbi:hypothetical protein BPLS_P1381 [Bathymodiolus platifrons methanotrophic gill symbiont]|uniref:DUF1566 domain-containing protein n=1 Tax=Bathymodiolus platifrons methanotrophic gill symbiont TaxID=113268 RepID=UPI001B3FA070|nr:DUF1566 domain-containing protein [Bathymodiolus platifrons methanotrophic gill symbiont]GFO74592.1 hypothetical protein BPLS_P1381 [Bathymodiolus platifrons methanotrophic gill symbiont]